MSCGEDGRGREPPGMSAARGPRRMDLLGASWVLGSTRAVKAQTHFALSLVLESGCVLLGTLSPGRRLLHVLPPTLESCGLLCAAWPFDLGGALGCPTVLFGMQPPREVSCLHGFTYKRHADGSPNFTSSTILSPLIQGHPDLRTRNDPVNTGTSGSMSPKLNSLFPF